MALGDVEPAHPGIADGIGDLESRHAGEIGDEAVDQKVDLHARGARHVVIFVADALFDLRHRMTDGCVTVGAQVLFHLADKIGMFIEQSAILGADGAGDAVQVPLQIIQNAAEILLVIHPAIKLGEHLIRIVDGSDGPIRSAVDHMSRYRLGRAPLPRIRASRNECARRRRPASNS